MSRVGSWPICQSGTCNGMTGCATILENVESQYKLFVPASCTRNTAWWSRKHYWNFTNRIRICSMRVKSESGTNQMKYNNNPRRRRKIRTMKIWGMIFHNHVRLSHPTTTTTTTETTETTETNCTRSEFIIKKKKYKEIKCNHNNPLHKLHNSSYQPKHKRPILSLLKSPQTISSQPHSNSLILSLSSSTIPKNTHTLSTQHPQTTFFSN
jgi:hypothetical protein